MKLPDFSLSLPWALRPVTNVSLRRLLSLRELLRRFGTQTASPSRTFMIAGA
jgi:hypothetical protein